MPQMLNDDAKPLLELELPFPSARLNPNRALGRKWQVLIQAKCDARDGAFLATLNALIDYARPVYVTAIELEFCAPNARKRDLDNLLAAMKPALDGVAQALGVNDADFRTITLRRGETCKGGKVIVTVK